MATKDKSIVRALRSFAGNLDGEEVAASEDDLFYTDDPAVRKWPELFGPVRVRNQRPDVEQATAAPGEKRGA